MSTVAQQFYCSNSAIDQTFSGANILRKLTEGVPGANSATTCTWTTTTVENRTIIPVSGSTVNSDTTNNNGWAHDNTGASGLGSTATDQRFIPAGVWTFKLDCTLNTPALLATISATITVKVYRVATGGGTRTLLFSTVGSAFSATGVQTINSASQPQYTLGAGEVIMVGYLVSSAATAATVVGAITNTVLTINLGANTGVLVPTPGVRTLSTRTPTESISVSESTTRFANVGRGPTDTASANDANVRSVRAARALTDTATPSDAVLRVQFSFRSTSESITTSDSVVRKVTSLRGPTDTATASDAIIRSVITSRSLADTATSNDVVTRKTTQFRGLTETITVSDSVVRIANFNRFPTESASATDILTRSAKYARSLTETVTTSDTVFRQINYRRFLDDNIGPAGGGTTIIIKRPIYIFDD